ncbi:MAG: chemotaxis protein CheW [Pyrinomonadaceae bacterium]
MAESLKGDLFDLEAIQQEGFTSMPDPFFGEDLDAEPEGEKYIVFQIGDLACAIPADNVSEVVRMLPLTEVPGLPSGYLGIANLRGDILTIVDPHALLNISSEIPLAKSKLIVLSIPGIGKNVAFKVDRLREIMVFADEMIGRPASTENRHVSGIVEQANGSVKILNVQDIINSISLR